MPLNFRNATEVTAGDSGYNNSDAIIPYTDGEGANQITFRRPPEYLRERSEVIRKAFDELEAVVSSDRGLMLLADPEVYVHWNGATSDGGDGKFSVTTAKALRFTPMISASNYSAEQDIWNRLTYVFDTDKQFTIRSRLRVCEGGSNIQVKFFFVDSVRFGGPSGTDVEVTIEGSKNDDGDYDPLFGPVLIKVQLSHDGAAIVSTWQDVIDGITGETEYANVWVEPSVTTGEEAVLAIAIDRQYLWEGIGLGIAGNQVAGCDAQGYSIPAADFVTFFGELENCLDEGDALILDFGSAQQRLATSPVDSVVGILRRLHRAEATEPPDPRSMSGQVNRMNAVPICKVIEGYLYFVSGIVISKDATGSLAPDNTLSGRLEDQTGIDAGETLVGAAVKSAATTPFPGDNTLPIGTVGTQLQRIYDELMKLNEMRILTPVSGDQYAKLRVKSRPSETSVNKQMEVVNSSDVSKFSVDVDGNTRVATGLQVGFTDGTPTADHIDVGDANLYLAWAEDVCSLNFASGSLFSYSRDNSRFAWKISTNERLRLTANGLTVGQGLRVGDHAYGSEPTDNKIHAVGEIEAGTDLKAGGNGYVASGLQVGFSGTPTADRIDVGDANLYLAWESDVCALNFKTGGSLFSFSRNNDWFSWKIATTEHLRLKTTGLMIGKGLVVGDETYGTAVPDNSVHAKGEIHADGSLTTDGLVDVGTDLILPTGNPGGIGRFRRQTYGGNLVGANGAVSLHYPAYTHVDYNKVLTGSGTFSTCTIAANTLHAGSVIKAKASFHTSLAAFSGAVSMFLNGITNLFLLGTPTGGWILTIDFEYVIGGDPGAAVSYRGYNQNILGGYLVTPVINYGVEDSPSLATNAPVTIECKCAWTSGTSVTLAAFTVEVS